MTSSARSAAVALIMLVVAGVAVSAQQPPSPMTGVWLFSPKPLPLAMLLAFREDTYDVVGRISYHGSEISFSRLDEDKGPHTYDAKGFGVEEARLTFRLVLGGVSYQAVGSRPGSLEARQPLHLLVDGTSVAELTPVPGLLPAAADVSSAPTSGAARSGTPSAEGWSATERGSLRIERFWEETTGARTVTYTLVSYKNTTQRTFTSAVQVRVAVYDPNNHLVGAEMRPLLASEHGPMVPGFVGTVKVPIEAGKDAARSVTVTVEAAD